MHSLKLFTYNMFNNATHKTKFLGMKFPICGAMRGILGFQILRNAQPAA